MENPFDFVTEEDLAGVSREELETIAGVFYRMAGAVNDAKEAHGTPEFRSKVERMLATVSDESEKLDGIV